MKYYISDAPLRLREFGRNIQSMVEHLKTLEDKDARTAVAHEIIKFMVCLKPSIKENPDYKQKLWDYLYLIAEGELDVDAPFEFPTTKPAHHPVGVRMPYPNRKPRYRATGSNLDLMAQHAVGMEPGPIRDEYINMMANAIYLLSTADLSQASNPEEAVAEQISKLSNGKIQLSASQIRINKVAPTHPHQQPQKPGGRAKKSRNRPKVRAQKKRR